MAITINDNFKVNAPKPIEWKYLNNTTSWADVAEVNTNIAPTTRHIWLTVNIAGVEYWYKDGTADVDLVIKEVDTSKTLQEVFDDTISDLWYVYWDAWGWYIEDDGWTLRIFSNDNWRSIEIWEIDWSFLEFKSESFPWGDDAVIKITDARTTKKWLEYDDDYSVDYTNRSLVDKEYVDEAVWAIVLADGSGTTVDWLSVDLWGTLTGNAQVLDKVHNKTVWFGTVNTTEFGYDSTNALDNFMVHANSRIFLGRAFDSRMVFSDTLWFFVEEANNSGRASFALGKSSTLAWEFVAKTYSTLNAVQNQITNNGNTGVRTIVYNWTNTMEALQWGNLHFQIQWAWTARFTDWRTWALATWLQYTADYSANFVDRSLVDKAYVDNIVTGVGNLQGDVAAGNPAVYPGSATTVKGDYWYVNSIAAGTLIGNKTVNVWDILFAKIDNPWQIDANWFVVESNRDQATETIVGVARIATDIEALAWTNDETIITPAKLATVLTTNIGAENWVYSDSWTLKLGWDLTENTNIDGAYTLNIGWTTALNEFRLTTGSDAYITSWYDLHLAASSYVYLYVWSFNDNWQISITSWWPAIYSWTTPPQVVDFTDDQQIVNKLYVDSAVSSAVVSHKETVSTTGSSYPYTATVTHNFDLTDATDFILKAYVGNDEIEVGVSAVDGDSLTITTAVATANIKVKILKI